MIVECAVMVVPLKLQCARAMKLASVPLESARHLAVLSAAGHLEGGLSPTGRGAKLVLKRRPAARATSCGTLGVVRLGVGGDAG